MSSIVVLQYKSVDISHRNSNNVIIFVSAGDNLISYVVNTLTAQMGINALLLQQEARNYLPYMRNIALPCEPDLSGLMFAPLIDLCNIIGEFREAFNKLFCFQYLLSS